VNCAFTFAVRPLKDLVRLGMKVINELDQAACGGSGPGIYELRRLEGYHWAVVTVDGTLAGKSGQLSASGHKVAEERIVCVQSQSLQFLREMNVIDSRLQPIGGVSGWAAAYKADYGALQAIVR
jgi:hypothetical protein